MTNDIVDILVPGYNVHILLRQETDGRLLLQQSIGRVPVFLHFGIEQIDRAIAALHNVCSLARQNVIDISATTIAPQCDTSARHF